MKNGDLLTITLDYDKNVYVSPNRSTVNLTNDLNSSPRHIVDEDLHNTLIEARNMQWIKKRAAPGYKIKRVKWYLLLDAFMKDYSDTCSMKQGARMTALMKKARIKDTDAANKTAIDSGMYESSAASEDFNQLLEDAGLDESSEELDNLLGQAVVSQQAERMYGTKKPRPTWEIEQHNRRNEKAAASKAAAGKQPMPYQGRGKTHIGFDHSMVHRYDNDVYSGYESSDPEIFGTVSEQGSSKRKIKSIPGHERIMKKSKKSEKEMSINEFDCCYTIGLE